MGLLWAGIWVLLGKIPGGRKPGEIQFGVWEDSKEAAPHPKLLLEKVWSVEDIHGMRWALRSFPTQSLGFWGSPEPDLTAATAPAALLSFLSNPAGNPCPLSRARCKGCLSLSKFLPLDAGQNLQGFVSRFGWDIGNFFPE